MRGRHGFALVETLVALAMIGLALPLLTSMLVGHRRSLSEAARMEDTMRLAHGLLEDAAARIGRGLPLQGGSGAHHGWSIETREIALDPTSSSWRLVEISVIRKGGLDRATPLRLSTLRLARRGD